MESQGVLEDQLQRWTVPSDVRDALRRAVAEVTADGVSLVEATLGDQVTVAVRGQPAALYVSPSGVSVGLDPVAAERAHRSDSALGLDKESETTWIVHCRFGRMDATRLNAVRGLMVKALRRYAPAPPPGTAPRARRRAASGDARGSAARSQPASAPRTSARHTAEDRQRAAEAAIPRCPVPGCNLPMVGGSCGFHD